MTVAFYRDKITLLKFLGENSDFCQDTDYLEVSSWSSPVNPHKRLDISSSGSEILLQSKRSVRFKMPRSQLKTYSKRKLMESYQKTTNYSSPISKSHI